MRVPFQLRRTAQAHAALAAVVPSRDPRILLDLCQQFGIDPTGRIFDVSGGYLLRLDTPTRRPMPGAIRLRAIVADLFIPVDAELTPALLDDEAEGLVRKQGMIFLPDGRALGFDPATPVALASLLTIPRLPERPWRGLPQRPQLADRIDEILLDRPEETPDSVLDAGDDHPIGTETPRPDEANPAATAAGRAAMSLGRAFAWMGRALGSGKLSELGARWIENAMRLAPRLSEDLLGRQAAAIHELLREFREGDIERALRRALPLGDSDEGGGGGGSAFGGDRLPAHDPSYRLSDILGSSSRSVWHVKRDVLTELREEYRKAAEEAVRRGDYRRAAAIYGKLLRDYRAAAITLSRGGLHHDAAIIYLVKLDDVAAAARAFEAAGEFDRAVQLYRQLKDHEAAGDLLRKLGEEDAAVDEYLAAAWRLSRSPSGDLKAGELLLAKAGRPDLALERFAAGWARRPAPNATSCGLRIAQLSAERGDVAALFRLLDEADDHFEPSNDTYEIARFYNRIGELAGHAPLASHRESLLDRALIGLTAHLRKLALPGAKIAGQVSTLLGQGDAWPASLVSDASFAVSVATKPLPRPELNPVEVPTLRRFRVGVGEVSAVALALETGDVAIGFEGGEVFVFRPEHSEVVRVAEYILPVMALTTNADASRIVVFRAHWQGHGMISTYARNPDGGYRTLLTLGLENVSNVVLTPIVTGMLRSVVGLWRDQKFTLFDVDTLQILESWEIRGTERTPPLLLLNDVDDFERSIEFHALEVRRQGEWTFIDREGRVVHQTGLHWRADLVSPTSLRSYTLSHAGQLEESLELAGLDDTGTVHWARLEEGNLVAHNVLSRPTPFLAATLVGPGLVAAVARNQIVWLRGGASAFLTWKISPIAIPSAVAAFTSAPTNELVVVCRDGFVARVPLV